MILLLVAALMGLTALALVAYPLLGLDRNGEYLTVPAPAGQLRYDSEISERESAARQALMDVDFDYNLGNLDALDYSELRDRYEERALLGIKARYERERELDAAIEQQLATLKSADKKGSTPLTPAAPQKRSAGAAPGASSAGPRRRRRKGAG